MKVICEGLDLSDAVLKVSKALSSRTTNPVLEGIKITAEGDTLPLLATDLDLTIEKKIKADVLMEGETVVVGKYFIDFIKKLENEQVELSRLYDEQLNIKYADSESVLQIFPVENYPLIDKKEEGNKFSLSKKDFKEIVEKTCFACSLDDSRPILKGCLFESKGNMLNVVSLDGFRMAIVKKEVKSENDFSAIIPARALQEMSRLIEKEDGDVIVNLQKNKLFVEIDNTVLISRLIEGEFVKYNHILPNSFENIVTVNKNALLNSIERASVVAKNDRYNIIRFDIKENIMTVSSKSEVGSVTENVNINLNGKDMSIAFNGKYLTDYLRICNDEFINFKLNSSIDPCVISPVEKEDNVYLVLPVRINA